MFFLNKEDFSTYTNQINIDKNNNNNNIIVEPNNLDKLNSNLSGSELDYKPDKWIHPYIQYSSNCYDYLLNNTNNKFDKCQDYCYQTYKQGCPKKNKKCRKIMKQPKNLVIKQKNDFNCDVLYNSITQDNKDIYKINHIDKCKKGYYKGASVIHPNRTFHFYRQNSDGSWSHKPGSKKVTNRDASNNIIYHPHLADRDYSHQSNKINYSKFCDYFCLKNNF